MPDIHSVIIIGSGPAAYTAGTYTSRAQLAPLLIGGEINGGQLMNTTLVENWPGAKDGIMGPELMTQMREQAAKFGTEIIDKKVTRVDFSQAVKKVYVQETEYQANTVIIATGAKSKPMGVPGEDRLLGRGVATCAVCDAALYKDKITYVVGGGDAAIEDAMALTKFATKVTILVRGAAMRASRIMQQRAEQHSKIEISYQTVVKEVRGEQKLAALVVEGPLGLQEMPADGVFVAIGHDPETEIFRDQVKLDEKGYLLTGLGLSHGGVELAQLRLNEGLVTYPSMTSVTGVFGAGDVVDYRYRQAVTAAGYGCMAALDAERYLQANGI